MDRGTTPSRGRRGLCSWRVCPTGHLTQIRLVAVAVRSLSFDDEKNDEDLFVCSGEDLLLTHYDLSDLDWGAIAERSAIDERRGLVIAQVAILEDTVDDFIHYIEDPVAPEQLQIMLDKKTIGPRLDRFEAGIESIGLLDDTAAELVGWLRSVVARRNQLAHGNLECRLAGFPIPAWELLTSDIELEWVLVDRRHKREDRISMKGLRADLSEAAGLFSTMLRFAETFVELAPRPVNFRTRRFLAAPTP